MSAKPKFAHVVFQTGQPGEMRDWYCTVLDGHVVYEDGALTFITFDEEHHRVALLHPPVPQQRKSPTTAAMHHVAYTFESIDDLPRRCRAAPADPGPPDTAPAYGRKCDSRKPGAR